MTRQTYLDLAASGLRMPIGTDLVLRGKSDPEAILHDARRLADVVLETADTYATPLAIPLMDLSAEKAALLEMMGVETADAGTFHFSHLPTKEQQERLAAALSAPAAQSSIFNPQSSIPLIRLAADIGAVSIIARQTQRIPIGMTIGPFSLMTKLMSDPITAIYSAGEGTSAADDEEVAMVETLLDLSRRLISWKIGLLLQAGARAIFIAEPAASAAFISPKQLSRNGSVWERFVMNTHRELRRQIAAGGAELIFHCCGELCPEMVSGFGSLDPALLSLGSSRRLWEDAARVGKRTVLYGNLPTKRFYSDSDISIEQVRVLSRELLARMRDTGHPFILGSECDVLSVPGSEETIKRKVRAMLERD